MPEDKTDTASFEQEAKDSFRFLEVGFDFARSSVRHASGVAVLSYESEKVFSSAYTTAHQNGTWRCPFGRHGVDEPPLGFVFSIGDLPSAAAMAQAAGGASSTVRLYAEVLKHDGAALLRGPDNEYEELQQARKARLTSWTNEMRLREATEAAGHAWRAKDYRSVVETLEPFSGQLDGVQSKRLGHAKRILALKEQS